MILVMLSPLFIILFIVLSITEERRRSKKRAQEKAQERHEDKIQAQQEDRYINAQRKKEEGSNIEQNHHPKDK